MMGMSVPKCGDTIDVWFSCGAASAVAAKTALALYGGTCNVRIINNPIAEEDADNKRFLLDVQDWLGVEIQYAINPKFPDCSIKTVFEEKRFMSSPWGAPCTNALKKGARQYWEKKNPSQWLVLGFTSEEQRRHTRFALTERPNILPVLIDRGVTKAMCFSILQQAGIILPRSYLRGYPNANCIGCVKSSSPTYWNLVRIIDPAIFAERAEQSRRLGCKLVRYKGRRIFLDELPPDAIGRPLKSHDFECGLFCEERE